MTEMLLREREFLKFNEELNKLATKNTTPNAVTNTIDCLLSAKRKEHQQQTSHTMSSNRNGHDPLQRYYTYTKAKGPSTLLKKRGAGDCISDAGGDMPQSQPQSSRQRHDTATRAGGGGGGGTTSRSTARHLRTRCDEDVTTVAGSLTAPSTQRRSIRSPERSMRGYSRTSNRTSGASNTSTNPFTIKYRNPKFVESPSLEVLLKDEFALLQRQSATMQKQSGSGDAQIEESAASLADSSEVATGGGAVVRRSQASSNIVPKKTLSTEGVIKFLKSKIVIMEEEHERISQEMNAQKELMEKTLERQKKVEQQRDQAFSKHNVLTDQLAKIEAHLDEANNRLKERISENNGQQKELELVRRELRILTQTNSNLEKRLYRANEDLENTKNALSLVKGSEREMKESMRIECESKDKQIKSLKKQRTDLLNVYKKQLFLIDNLKRQNVCIEQSKLIGYGEREFTKVLEWNAKM